MWLCQRVRDEIRCESRGLACFVSVRAPPGCIVPACLTLLRLYRRITGWIPSTRRGEEGDMNTRSETTGRRGNRGEKCRMTGNIKLGIRSDWILAVDNKRLWDDPFKLKFVLISINKIMDNHVSLLPDLLFTKFDLSHTVCYLPALCYLLFCYVYF